MSVEDLEGLFEGLNLNRQAEIMNRAEIQSLLEAAVRSATEAQKREFDRKFEELSQKFSNLSTNNLEIEPYKEVEIQENIACNIPLDVVKSLPEFDGTIQNYVSWRQAAHTAYKIFKKYDGSYQHYQAIAIIRNKIKGKADAELSSYNTVLNFNAIIARLDITYADKRPVHLIEQELSTLRQGNQTVLEFFDTVERKLMLLTNKTIMSQENEMALVMNEKYRNDALRVFISGLKKPLCDILFSTRPTSMQNALVLAQEVEFNHERYMFATTFANKKEENGNKNQSAKQYKNGDREGYRGKNPYFSKNAGNENNHGKGQNPPEPMDVDPSVSRLKQKTNFQSGNKYSRSQGYVSNTEVQHAKRPPSSDRATGPKLQRINHIAHEGEGACGYSEAADTAVREVDDELADSDIINFLEVGPSCRL